MKQMVYIYTQLPEQTEFVTLGRLTVENNLFNQYNIGYNQSD